MKGSRGYVLDANVFIEAKNKYYAFDLCPGFWKALIAEHRTKRLFSIDKVRDELVQKRNETDKEPDLLSDWAKNVVPDTFFKQSKDRSVIDDFREMVVWVSVESQFTSAAKAEFSSVADGWVVAYAKVNELIVVTHETYAPDAEKRVPLPNVCHKFGVEYVNTFEMLKDLKVRFVLRH